MSAVYEKANGRPVVLRFNLDHLRALRRHSHQAGVVVDQRCFDLQKKGFIRPIGSGHYQLTAEGKRRLRKLHALER